jgi:hypothetical protein
MGNAARKLVNSFLFAAVVALTIGLCTTSVFQPADARAEAMSYDGYLADVLCATRGTALDGADMLKHPEKHSAECLKEPPCAASGYGVLTKGMGDTYTFQKFDKKGNELAAELIKKTKKKDSFTVKVTGQAKDGVINVESLMEK